MKTPSKITEKWVKEKIKKILKELDIWYFMPLGGWYGRAGIPDFICCIGGLFVSIEAKTSKGKLSEFQAVENDRIAKHAGYAFIVDEYTLEILRIELEGIVWTETNIAKLDRQVIDLRGQQNV